MHANLAYMLFLSGNNEEAYALFKRTIKLGFRMFSASDKTIFTIFIAFATLLFAICLKYDWAFEILNFCG